MQTKQLAKDGRNAVEFDALAATAQRMFGYINFTALAWIPDRNALQRIYTCNERYMPLFAEHTVSPDHFCRTVVIDAQQPMLSPTAADVKNNFPAWQSSYAMGVTCIYNIPVVGPDGRTMGQLNFGNKEGLWGREVVDQMQIVAKELGVEAFTKWRERVPDWALLPL